MPDPLVFFTALTLGALTVAISPMSIERRCQTRRFPPSYLAQTHRLKRALSRRWVFVNLRESCASKGLDLVESLSVPHYASGDVVAGLYFVVSVHLCFLRFLYSSFFAGFVLLPLLFAGFSVFFCFCQLFPYLFFY
jgi:hypothetical protein